MYTENPAGCLGRDSISGESHDSLKQSMLQSLMSLWKEILGLSSSTLLSKDWTLASKILRSGGWCARLLSRTRSPLQIPLLCRQHLGAASWVEKSYLVVMLVFFCCSFYPFSSPISSYPIDSCKSRTNSGRGEGWEPCVLRNTTLPSHTTRLTQKAAAPTCRRKHRTTGDHVSVHASGPHRSS